MTGFGGFDSPMAGKWLEMLTQLRRYCLVTGDCTLRVERNICIINAELTG